MTIDEDVIARRAIWLLKSKGYTPDEVTNAMREMIKTDRPFKEHDYGRDPNDDDREREPASK